MEPDQISALSEKEFLDFIGLALIAPIVATLAAFFAARIGVSGKLRQLEYLEKRLDVLTSLLSKTDTDDEIKESLRSQIRDITAEVLSLGSTSGANKQSDSRSALSLAAGSRPWQNYPWYRQYIFPPWTPSFSGVLAGVLYYYFGLVFLALVVSAFVDPQGNDAIVGFLVGMPFAYFVILNPLRLWMRSAHNAKRHRWAERERIADHIVRQSIG